MNTYIKVSDGNRHFSELEAENEQLKKDVVHFSGEDEMAERVYFGDREIRSVEKKLKRLCIEELWWNFELSRRY